MSLRVWKETRSLSHLQAEEVTSDSLTRPELGLRTAGTDFEKWKILLLVPHLSVAQRIVLPAFVLKGQVSPAWGLRVLG